MYDRNRNFGRNFGEIGRNISAESFGQPAEIPKRQKNVILTNFSQIFDNLFQNLRGIFFSINEYHLGVTVMPHMI